MKQVHFIFILLLCCLSSCWLLSDVKRYRLNEEDLKWVSFCDVNDTIIFKSDHDHALDSFVVTRVYINNLPDSIQPTNTSLSSNFLFREAYAEASIHMAMLKNGELVDTDDVFEKNRYHECFTISFCLRILDSPHDLHYTFLVGDMHIHSISEKTIQELTVDDYPGYRDDIVIRLDDGEPYTFKEERIQKYYTDISNLYWSRDSGLISYTLDDGTVYQRYKHIKADNQSHKCHRIK